MGHRCEVLRLGLSYKCTLCNFKIGCRRRCASREFSPWGGLKYLRLIYSTHKYTWGWASLKKSDSAKIWVPSDLSTFSEQMLEKWFCSFMKWLSEGIYLFKNHDLPEYSLPPSYPTFCRKISTSSPAFFWPFKLCTGLHIPIIFIF